MSTHDPERKEKKHKKSTLAKLKDELVGQKSAPAPVSSSPLVLPPSKVPGPQKDRDIIVQADSFAPHVQRSSSSNTSIDEAVRASAPERTSPEEKKKGSSRQDRADTSPRQVINPIFGAKLRGSTSGSHQVAHQATAPSGPSPREKGESPRHSSAHSSPRFPPVRADVAAERRHDAHPNGRLDQSISEETPPMEVKERSETSSSSEKRLERSKSETRLQSYESRNRHSTNSSSSRSGATPEARGGRSPSTAKASDEVRTENPLFQRVDPNASPRQNERNFASLGTLVDIMHVKQSELIARHMFSLICIHADRLRKLMRWSLTREFHQTIEQPEQLFRHDSVPTRLLTAYFKMYGSSYLHAALKPTVRRVLDEAPFEVDPVKLPSGKTGKEGYERIKSLVQSLLADIMRTSANLPPFDTEVVTKCFRQLRRVVGNIKRVKAHDEHHHRIAFCALFFLRFVSPAMVAPETLGTEAPSPDARRGLVLLSKVLQAVVTGVEFGEKEPYMLPLNSIIRDNGGFVSALIARITLKSKKQRTRSMMVEMKSAPVSPYAQDHPEEALDFFQQEFASCKDKITKRLAKDAPQAHSLFVTYASSLKAQPRRVQVESTMLEYLGGGGSTLGSDLRRTVSTDAGPGDRNSMRRSFSEDSLHSSAVSKPVLAVASAPSLLLPATLLPNVPSGNSGLPVMPRNDAEKERTVSEASSHAHFPQPTPRDATSTNAKRDPSTKVKTSAALDVRYLQMRLQAETVARQTLERQADLEREVDIRKHIVLRLSRWEGAAIFEEFPDSPQFMPTYSAPLPATPAGARARGLSM